MNAKLAELVWDIVTHGAAMIAVWRSARYWYKKQLLSAWKKNSQKVTDTLNGQLDGNPTDQITIKKENTVWIVYRTVGMIYMCQARTAGQAWALATDQRKGEILWQSQENLNETLERSDQDL